MLDVHATGVVAGCSWGFMFIRTEVNHPDFKKFDTSSMTNVGGGGAAFAAPMIKRVRQTFEKARSLRLLTLAAGKILECVQEAVTDMQVLPNRQSCQG